MSGLQKDTFEPSSAVCLGEIVLHNPNCICQCFLVTVILSSYSETLLCQITLACEEIQGRETSEKNCYKAGN